MENPIRLDKLKKGERFFCDGQIFTVTDGEPHQTLAGLIVCASISGEIRYFFSSKEVEPVPPKNSSEFDKLEKEIVEAHLS